MTENKKSDSRWNLERPPRGRPKKEEADRRTVILQIRVTEEERDRLMEEFGKTGNRTFSEWMREKILK